LCDGPVQFSGSTGSNLELIPPAKKSSAEIVHVNMPFATNLLGHELATFMNMGMRFITTRGLQKLRQPTSTISDEAAETLAAARNTFVAVGLPERRLPDYRVPEATAVAESSNSANSLEELQREAERLGLTVIPKDVAGVEALPFTAAKQATGVPLAPLAEVDEENVESAENANMGMMVAPVRTEEEMAKEVGSNGRGVEMAPVLSFDTSVPAMMADGLTMPSEAGLAPPPPAAAYEPRRRNRSPGPLRVSNEATPPAANAVVTVNKMG